MLQQTVAGFEVRCCASQRLHEARRGVHSCVQAAAAARVAGGLSILDSAGNGDCVSVPAQYNMYRGDGVRVLCHVIADADAVNKRDDL